MKKEKKIIRLIEKIANSKLAAFLTFPIMYPFILYERVWRTDKIFKFGEKIKKVFPNEKS